MKRLLALAALLIPIYLFAQGFGSFSHDQPFLAKDVVSGGSGPIPLGNLYVWINPTTNKTFKSNLGTTNVSTDADSIGTVLDSSPSAYSFTNSESDSQVNIRWYSSKNGNTNPVINCNWSQSRLFSGATSVSLTNWVFIVDYMDTSGGFGGLQGSTFGSGSDSNYFLKYVGGADASFFQANGGGTLPFTMYENAWRLLTIYSEYSTSGGRVTIRTNGVQQSTSTTITHAMLNSMKLCANGTYRWRGNIAEVIVYGGAQTSNQVWVIENYLRRHPFPYAGP